MWGHDSRRSWRSRLFVAGAEVGEGGRGTIALLSCLSVAAVLFDDVA